MVKDLLLGLGKAFKERSSEAKLKFCGIQLSRNALARESRHVKASNADDRHSVFYASLMQEIADALSLTFFLCVCVLIVNNIL